MLNDAQLRNYSDEELLRYVDRSHGEVRALCERLETFLSQEPVCERGACQYVGLKDAVNNLTSELINARAELSEAKLRIQQLEGKQVA